MLKCLDVVKSQQLEYKLQLHQSSGVEVDEDDQPVSRSLEVSDLLVRCGVVLTCSVDEDDGEKVGEVKLVLTLT